ncbi:hypothetical protein, partial [Parabacteroides goldsteinii]|uniref:hypothetical protein n=1 Tax=Parabacteroides goldsteinii TaxID=328812 RepID=UPI001C3F0908
NGSTRLKSGRIIGMSVVLVAIVIQFMYVKVKNKRLCQNAGTTFFYAQSPDFHKPRLCYYPKFLYL